ncbi:hypothetical protein KXD40_006639 [Peronospora effusa]|nr:hypothetical protein KXD40_006639 [Peronospora effusa]
MEHHFVFSMATFKDENPATITMCMRDRAIDPNSLKKEVRNHVEKYLQFCDADSDSVLRRGSRINTASQSAEEARALVL